MSKMDAMRAMREARYENRPAPTAPRTAPPTAVRPSAPETAPEAAVAAEPAVEAAATTEQPCGHRSMNGRTCTREHGHAAKSHRYS